MESFFDYFLPYARQFVVLILGLILLFFASIGQKPDSGHSKKATFDLGPIKGIPIRSMPQMVSSLLWISGSLCTVIGLAWFLVSASSSPVHAVSKCGELISARFFNASWNPRLIDLRTVEEEGNGIPIDSNAAYPFRLTDLWVSSDESLVGYQAQANVYVTGELIGSTDKVALQKTNTSLGNVTPMSYRSRTDPTGWDLGKDWKNLDIQVVCFQKEKEVGETHTTIHFNTAGSSWLQSPPFASLVAVEYTINGSQPKLMDFRNILEWGTSPDETSLNLAEGDEFTITNVWYNSRSGIKSRQMKLDAYLDPGGIEDGSELISNFSAIDDRNGTFPFQFMPFNWTIPAGKTILVLTVIRDDNAILDRMVIDLKPGKDIGLVPAADMVQWPYDEADYFDFENGLDTNAWQAEEQNQIAVSEEEFFTGTHSLMVTSTSSKDQVLLGNKQPGRIRAIAGEVYWPAEEGMQPEWAEVCVQANFTKCFDLALQKDTWNPFLVDLTKVSDDKGTTLDINQVSWVYIQGGFSSVSASTPYSFYLDGLQSFKVK